MTLAINHRTKSGERVAYVTLKLIGKRAETANTHLRKGSGLLVAGRIETRSYDGKGGIRRYVTEVLVHEMQFLDRVDGAGDAPANGHDDVDELDDGAASL